MQVEIEKYCFITAMENTDSEVPMKNYKFLDKNGSFELEQAENDLGFYFPLAGENGLKSAITPNLGGDSKSDQNHFLMEPVSIENLHNNKGTRNFWCKFDCEREPKRSGIWSACGVSAPQEAARFTNQQDVSKVQAGYMWHKQIRESTVHQVRAEITNFIPIQQNVEIMQVVLLNVGTTPIRITPTAAIPIYGRSADNIRDHRHVTSLLHRAVISEYGIEVTPTLSFDERGHQENDTTYYVLGAEEGEKPPTGFFPEAGMYLGKAGSYLWPQAVVTEDVTPLTYMDKATVDGQEIVGALRFAEKILQPGACATYLIYMGLCPKTQKPIEEIASLRSIKNVQHELELTKQYWMNKCNVFYQTGDERFDHFMAWVSFQPELRRIFGCSFLPHHDYGKGGRGWRDLWQDCLALLLMNPAGVRQMLLSNFGGVRIDGTNATIIGDHFGEFKADRNSITRVWMDHGVWPFVTTKLYIDQTGDADILYQRTAYFKDRQVARGTRIDEKWEPEQKWQMDAGNEIYQGSVMEHLLLQNLTAFYEVGEHNHSRLRDADWNDALDMASQRGESVAFTNAYAMNLQDLAEMLKHEEARGIEHIEILQEAEPLLQFPRRDYDNVTKKQALLEQYGSACMHEVSGNCVKMAIRMVIENLEEKATWIKEHIRNTEWVQDKNGNGWFNGYYDNHGRQVEGVSENGNVRMMLTGQVFAIMAKTATDAQVMQIAKATDQYLYDAQCGGYRLNTDFKEVKMDMGRMFGFAYGEKENGAVFSHMAVMYANALYQRDYVKEGYKALHALYSQAMNFEKSRIYPGIPEYFGKDGRGLYHYLTGAASWYMLTVITQMFGVRGEYGNLVAEPKLLARQFDKDGKAYLTLKFQGVEWVIAFENENHLEYGNYQIAKAYVEDQIYEVSEPKFVFAKEEIQKRDKRKTCHVRLILSEKGAKYE